MDYISIFSFDLIIGSSKNIDINKYAIKLVKDKQLSYRLIYSQKPVKLEILKTYIKIKLKIRFIQSFKSSIKVSIFFNQKLDRKLYLCINYQDLNNLTIKNWYFLLLIDETLDRLSQAKYFTQLDLTNIYHKIKI